MPRFKNYDYNQTKMLPISFDRQILQGTFEYSLNYLIDHEIEQLCRDNIIFMALSADSQPHYTTIADFISGRPDAIGDLFLQILLTCDDLELIGKDMFAIDGCKMPSNASKQWSGKHADLKKKHKKIDRAVRRMLKKHREDDTLSPDIVDRDRQQIEKIKAASQKIKKHLTVHTKRIGVSGNEVQGNITDNDSAKMKTSHGVIQGYTGVAAVDNKHQVIVAAEAYGQGQEHGLLQPMIEQAHTNLGSSKRRKHKTKITADSGYHNKDTLEYLEEHKHDAYIADVGFRSRDPRFKDYKDHKDKKRLRPKKQFKNEDFKVNRTKLTCACPAGKAMWLKSKVGTIQGYKFLQFQAHERDCPACPLKKRCLRKPDQKTPRQVNFKVGQTTKHKDSVIERMKRKIDSTQGRYIYSKRLGTVEPVFGHINTMIGIKRFSHRGKQKVNAQWQLMSTLHNILKIHRYGWEW